MEYARQIEKDIPDSYLLIKNVRNNVSHNLGNHNPIPHLVLNDEKIDESNRISFGQSTEKIMTNRSESEFFEIDLLGNYREEIISIFESPFHS
jgi:hypothetical protein